MDGGTNGTDSALRTQRGIQKVAEMLLKRHPNDPKYKKLLYTAQERIKELEGNGNKENSQE